VPSGERTNPANRGDHRRSIRQLPIGPGVSLGFAVVVAVIASVFVFQAIAVVSAVVRVVQLLAVAAVAGWAGWKLGVAYGRRERP
jgi:hypothetical protein